MSVVLDRPELTQGQFQSISRMVKEMCGINLHEGKMALVRARLNKRLRALGLSDFGSYVERLQHDADGAETRAMLDALSTNQTGFFREPKHFEVLRERVLPALFERRREEKKVRIWSAGCSSGEEPYTIAITLWHAMLNPAEWDVAILATDISGAMVRVGSEGIYKAERLRDVPKPLLHEHFRRTAAGSAKTYRVEQTLRRMVHFARLNLFDPWPMKGLFDVIFCRNVMIYFEKPTQERLVQRFVQHLAPGGTLFIGHSESLTGIRHGLRYVQPTVYEKP